MHEIKWDAIHMRLHGESVPEPTSVAEAIEIKAA